MLTLIVAAGLGQCHAAATTYCPTTHAAPAHHAPAHHAVNFVGFVAVDPYHSTVGAAARAESKAAADAKVTADLTAQLGALSTAIATLAGPPAGEYGVGEAPGVLPPGSDPQPGKIVRKPPPPDNTAPAHVSVITASCLGCHNPAKQSGGLSFADERGRLLDLDADTKLAMLESVAGGRMPKTKDKGSPAARRALVDWIKADSDKLLAAIKDNGK